MSRRIELRQALAEFLRETFGTHVGVTAGMVNPANLKASSAFIVAQDTYTIHRGDGAGTFCKPSVSLRIVLVAPALGEWPQRQDWLDERLDELVVAMKGTDRVGEFRCPSIVDTKPAIIAENQALLGIYVDLTPVQVAIDN